MSEHFVYLDERLSRWERQVPLVAPGTGRACTRCELYNAAREFRPSPDHVSGLYSVCRSCENVLDRERKAELHKDPEERAKHVLRQRAAKGHLSWALWRELREQKRCAEFLAAHPFSRTDKPYGYVYVLMTFADEVLYVGQAKDVETRLFITPQSHRWDKEWWPQVAQVEVYTYHKQDYDEAERWLIQELNPVYNKVRPKPRRDTKPEPLSVVRGSIYEGAIIWKSQ